MKTLILEFLRHVVVGGIAFLTNPTAGTDDHVLSLGSFSRKTGDWWIDFVCDGKLYRFGQEHGGEGLLKVSCYAARTKDDAVLIWMFGGWRFSANGFVGSHDGANFILMKIFAISYWPKGGCSDIIHFNEKR